MPEPAWRRLLAEADRRTAAVLRDFLQAVREAEAAASRTRIAAALAARRLDEVVRIVSEAWDDTARRWRSTLAGRSLDALAAGGDIAAGGLRIEVAIAFDRTNPAAVAFARERAATLVTHVSREQRQALRETITRAFTDQTDVWRTSRAIRQVIGLRPDQARALATYRAELQALAQSAGPVTRSTRMRRLSSKGLTPERIDAWVEKYRQRLLRQRANSIARTECLVGATSVSGAVVRAAYRRPFNGEVVTVRTEAGREFTATPNHPMLTQRGWLGSGFITKGDYLVCDARQQHARAAGQEDMACRPAAISEVFASTSALGQLEHRRGSELDFHGDGKKSEIEIARPNRPLMVGRFSALYKPSLKQVLASAYQCGETLYCPECSRLLAVNQSICGCPGSKRNTSGQQSIADGRLADTELSRHLAGGNSACVSRYEVGGVDQLLFGGTAPRKTSLADDARDPALGEWHSFGDVPRGEAGFIQLDRVVSVLFGWTSGHVYNLSTDSGYFTISGGVYTGNTLTASNRGQLELWRQAIADGQLPPGAMKQWLTVEDDRRCERCMAMDRQTVPVDAPFIEPRTGLQILTPSLHPHCRCVMSLAAIPRTGLPRAAA